MVERLNRYAGVLALGALVIAVVGAGVAGAGAAGVLVTSKQIKNGTILTQDIHKNGVKSSDLATDSVKSSDIGEGQVGTGDIGEGQVQPQDVTMPAPEQLTEPAGETSSAVVGGDFTLVDTVGTYTKESADSVLEVDWTGSVRSAQLACVFQIRVDGHAPDKGGAEAYVGNNGSTASVSASALFGALPSGPHQIEVWGRSIADPYDSSAECTVGPQSAGISQSFVVSEQVV